MVLLSTTVNQAQAASSISDLAFEFSGQGYFNCSYKGRKASKKCLVTMTEGRGSIDSRISSFYGPGQHFSQMNIKWPDGDISRYALMRDRVIINLGDKNHYEEHGYDFNTGSYPRGFFIYTKGKEHIRLW